jgi:hypothetical protein
VAEIERSYLLVWEWQHRRATIATAEMDNRLVLEIVEACGKDRMGGSVVRTLVKTVTIVVLQLQQFLLLHRLLKNSPSVFGIPFKILLRVVNKKNEKRASTRILPNALLQYPVCQTQFPSKPKICQGRIEA